jgi:hypothetical protein
MSRSSFFSVLTPDSLPGGSRRTACGFMNQVSDPD